MRLTELSDDELREVSKQKIKRGVRQGCYTAEANRAMGILRARHNSFIDAGFGNIPRDHSCFNGEVIIIQKGKSND